MQKNCLNCVHKDVCIERSMALFMLFIQTGRYNEVSSAKENLVVREYCENWKEGKKHEAQ